MEEELPLVVDLDGTLVKSDMALETFVAALSRMPWILPMVPFWLLAGRARLKRELALRAAPSPGDLPYRDEVLQWIDAERARGRRHIVLATAADERIARGIADHLGRFDEVVASDGKRNLKGPAKREALVERFGERGFDYAGDGVADLAVWSAARRAIVVGNGAALFAAAGKRARETLAIRVAPRTARAFASALRVHQWPKNLLVFVPLVTAHRVADPAAIAQTLVAFASFCLVASAIYVANDLVDLAADRAHPSRRRRAFAAGDLGIGWGIGLAPLLLAAGIVIAGMASPWLAAIMAAYALLGVLYSAGLKRVAVVDIFVIATFYTMRILAGAAAIDVTVSNWLFAFSMFVFVSLALAKRHAELRGATPGNADAVRALSARGYRPDDAPGVGVLGAISGCLSVVVLAFYITSREVTVLYSRPEVLWLSALLLFYWITRAWLLAFRGELGDDPLAFALRDPQSYAVGAATLLVLFLAT